MNTEAVKSFAAALRAYRERAGLTQETLAEQAGLTRNAISALERGERRNPFPYTVQALATALALPPHAREQLLTLARAKHVPFQDAQTNQPVAPFQSQVSQLSIKPLPVPSTALIGRDAERALLVGMLTSDEKRLITVVGPGGVGKTRLALEVAVDLFAHYPDGVAWVALASITDGNHVASAIADALGLVLQGGRPPGDQLCDALAERSLLLILDNMEQVLDATDLVPVLLAQSPNLQILVTSRERLRIAGEHVLSLGGLALPAKNMHDATSTEAVQLFVERARQATHDFALTSANAAAIGAICTLVEGLPLGIELAATWIGVLSPQEIADEISRTIDFLARSDRNAPARHRSFRAVLDHSWNLLTEDERRVFARLAVFRGGWNRAAAVTVAGASLDVLAALVDKSLVRRVESHGDGTRYDLHDVLRQYALAKLQVLPEEECHTRDLHCIYYARQLGSRTDALQSSSAYIAWAEVVADLENIRVAWTRAVETRDHQVFALMGQSIQVICEIQGLFQEGVALFAAATASLRAAITAEEAGTSGHNPELLWTLGHILSLYGNRAARCGHFTEARDRLTEAHALLQQRGDLLVRSGTLFFLGYMTYVLGEYDDARNWLSNSIDLSRAHGDSFFQASSEALLAMVAQSQGNDDEAQAAAQASVDHWRVNGHPRGMALGLWALSNVLRVRGKLAEAEEAAKNGLHLAAEIRDPWTTGALLLVIGAIALDRSQLGEARTLFTEGAAMFRNLGDPWSEGRATFALGLVAQAEGNINEARNHFERTVHIGQTSQLNSVMLDGQYGLAALRSATDPESACTVLKQIIDHPATKRITRDRALRLHATLLAGDQQPITTPQSQTSGLHIAETGETLTPREIEVLQLLAQGHSNQMIANELVVTVGTVKRHVNSLLGKLQAQSRLAAVARARELGLM